MERSRGESDPRLFIIPYRLASVKRIIAVMSSKGGVGKTVVATLAALNLASKGFKTGLLDLDFTNPSTHLVLGVNPLDYVPEEEKGILPPVIHGVKYLSIAMYSGDKPLPLRGEGVDNAFREILAITRWGDLDYLLIDTPPGMGDEHLNLLTYLGDRVEIVLVSTPSKLALKSVERLIELLRDGGYKILGLIGNMDDKGLIEKYCVERRIDYLGSIPYDPEFENVLGDLESIRQTIIWNKLDEIVDKLVEISRG